MSLNNYTQSKAFLKMEPSNKNKDDIYYRLQG